MKKSSFKSKSANTSYRTEIIHDVPAADVAGIIQEKSKETGYRTHAILPESDGEFTLIFVFDD